MPRQQINKVILFALVFLIVDCYARPVAEPLTDSDDASSILHSRLINAHSRTVSRKRHAEIRLSSEISRRMEELRRIQLLNNIMAGLEPNKVYSVKVYPTVPSHKEISPQLLKQLNGQVLPGGVKMRIIQDKQVQAPVAAEQFQSYIQNAQNAVALAKTCRDMQEMIARNNLRLRVKCHPARNDGQSSHSHHNES